MNEKAKQTSQALKLSIATASLLTIVKFAAGFLTHSMAVFASALDSLMDVGNSSVNFVAASKAAKPPDEDHAYGHGKIESLAGLFQSMFIGVSGLYVMAESVKRLILGARLEQIRWGIGVMIFSSALTFLLVWRLSHVARQNKSMILATEKVHFSMDLLTNGGSLLALVLVRFSGWSFWDLLVSMAIAVYIFKTSYGIFRRAIDELLDKALPPVSHAEIENLIRHFHPSVVGLHNFRSRQVGEQIFMDFHIEIRGVENFRRAHDVTESLITSIQQQYPGADVTVHYDPEGEN